jgi:short-subunit dehydrogenase
MAAACERIVEADKRIDLWFNNAGVAGLGGFQDLKAGDFDRVIDVNLKGLITGTRLALKQMESQGAGIIVNMASVAGHIAPPFMSAYAATKFAVVGFSRALREELKLRDCPVRVVMVSPGFVDTAILARGQRIGFPEWLTWALSTPEQVAQDILMGLAREEEEIFPTWNGKVMLQAHRYFPRAMMRGSRLLLVKRFRDLFLNRYTVD